MKLSCVLGIDAGASSTRWLLLDLSGKELAQGKVAPLTGHVFTAKDKAENLTCLEHLLKDVGAVTKPEALVLGMTGLHKGTESANFYFDYFTKVFALDGAKIALDNDMHIAFASVFEAGEGVLVYAGTGAVGYHETHLGEVIRAGGYGYMIDDAGAGYWLGHEAIKYVMRSFDEFGKPATTPLAQLVYKDLGSSDWDDIVGVIYGGGRAKVASLAPLLAEAAHAKDEVAVQILQRGGQELARLGNCILGRLGEPKPVVFSGGITRLSPILTKSLEQSLRNLSSFSVIDSEPVYAAAKLALKLLEKSD